MKIKRKEYNRLKAIANSTFILDSKAGELLHATFEHMYLVGLYGGGDDNMWIHGPVRIIIKPERATLPSASTTPIPATEPKEM